MIQRNGQKKSIFIPFQGMQIMNYSRCIESVGYAHVLSVTLYFVAVYCRGFEASNLEHVSRLMLSIMVGYYTFFSCFLCFLRLLSGSN